MSLLYVKLVTAFSMLRSGMVSSRLAVKLPADTSLISMLDTVARPFRMEKLLRSCGSSKGAHVT